MIDPSKTPPRYLVVAWTVNDDGEEHRPYFVMENGERCDIPAGLSKDEAIAACHAHRNAILREALESWRDEACKPCRDGIPGETSDQGNFFHMEGEWPNTTLTHCPCPDFIRRRIEALAGDVNPT